MNNNIIIQKIKDNEFVSFDPLFKQPNRMKKITPKMNWLCSMNILNNLPNDNKPHDLIEYLINERDKYIEDDFTLEQIDFFINLEVV